MRFKVGLTDEEISLDNVRVIDKGSLKMAFTLVKYQPRAPAVTKFTDCKYFEVADKRWVNLPQKEVQKTGSDKKDYYPVVLFEDKEYMDQLKCAVIQAVKAHREQGVQQQAPTKQHNVQAASPFGLF